MTTSFLETIIAEKRKRIEAAKKIVGVSEIVAKARRMVETRQQTSLRAALSDDSRINIIAEFKRASPSKGVINRCADPIETAILYRDGGAAAISVLTEEDFFKGSLDDLQSIRKAVHLPLLRKDFIIDEYQIYESAIAGADAILLIVAALNRQELETYAAIAEELGLEALVEVHDKEELEIALAAGARLVGVNNRDLNTFEVSLDASRDIAAYVKGDVLSVSESGISTRDELLELNSLGYSGFLLGETLMRSGDTTASLLQLSRCRNDEHLSNVTV